MGQRSVRLLNFNTVEKVPALTTFYWAMSREEISCLGYATMIDGEARVRGCSGEGHVHINLKKAVTPVVNVDRGQSVHHDGLMSIVVQR